MTRYNLARTAGILGSNPEFRRFLAERFPAAWKDFSDLQDPERAAAVVRDVCGITSRSELDRSPAAAQRFHHEIGLPFSAWRRAQSFGQNVDPQLEQHEGLKHATALRAMHGSISNDTTKEEIDQ